MAGLFGNLFKDSGVEQWAPLAGGVLGSVIPGLGTAVGAGLGGIFGSIAGAGQGGSTPRLLPPTEQEIQMQELQNQLMMMQMGYMEPMLQAQLPAAQYQLALATGVGLTPGSTFGGGAAGTVPPWQIPGGLTGGQMPAEVPPEAAQQLPAAPGQLPGQIPMFDPAGGPGANTLTVQGLQNIQANREAQAGATNPYSKGEYTAKELTSLLSGYMSDRPGEVSGGFGSGITRKVLEGLGVGKHGTYEGSISDFIAEIDKAGYGKNTKRISLPPESDFTSTKPTTQTGGDGQMAAPSSLQNRFGQLPGVTPQLDAAAPGSQFTLPGMTGGGTAQPGQFTSPGIPSPGATTGLGGGYQLTPGQQGGFGGGYQQPTGGFGGGYGQGGGFGGYGQPQPQQGFAGAGFGGGGYGGGGYQPQAQAMTPQWGQGSLGGIPNYAEFNEQMGGTMGTGAQAQMARDLAQVGITPYQQAYQQAQLGAETGLIPQRAGLEAAQLGASGRLLPGQEAMMGAQFGLGTGQAQMQSGLLPAQQALTQGLLTGGQLPGQFGQIGQDYGQDPNVQMALNQAMQTMQNQRGLTPQNFGGMGDVLARQAALIGQQTAAQQRGENLALLQTGLGSAGGFR